jgi:DNA-binding CsgD family transcriptional regulator
MMVNERLLLDAMRHRLEVAALHITYVQTAGAPELQLRAGRQNHEFENVSPYHWDDSLLYRTKQFEREYVSQMVYFGNRGSASLLQIIHSIPFDALFDKLVAEHYKFHAVLFSKVDIDVHASNLRLTAKERLMVSWAAKGLTTKETAKLLKLDPRAVEHNLRMARLKLDAPTVSALVYLAIRSRQLD